MGGAPGEGGVASLLPIQGSSARKGYPFRASGLRKGRDFTSSSI